MLSGSHSDPDNMDKNLKVIISSKIIKYLIIKNIEVLLVKNFQDKSNSLISNTGNNLTTIYLKCNINEAPYIAELSSTGKYKIIIGNNLK